MKILITILLLLFSCSITYSQTETADLQIESVTVSKPPLYYYEINVTASNLGNSIAQNPRLIVFLPALMAVVETPPNCQSGFTSAETSFPLWMICSFNNLELKQSLTLKTAVVKPHFMPMTLLISVESDTHDMNFNNNSHSILLK
jgi:hypothetical protein